jgi:hypothetical protein
MLDFCGFFAVAVAVRLGDGQRLGWSGGFAYDHDKRLGMGSNGW